MISRRTFLGVLALACAAAFALADGLRFEPWKDELHFLESSQAFRGAFDLQALRSYPEVVTPLALVIWGELDHFTGDGLFYGRLLNFALTIAMVCLVAFCAPQHWPRAGRAGLGLLLFPYTLPLATNLYTDTIGVFLAISGTLALAWGRPLLGACAFVCAIATRQYLVQIPAALAAAEAARWLRGEPVRWNVVTACAASCLTVVGWVTFFGGLAPRAGIAFWTPLYPSPMLHPTEFILSQGLFALTGIGAYFVAVEALLFRRNPVSIEMLSARGMLLALILAGLFWLDPPVLNPAFPGGPIGRIAIAALPAPDYDWARVSLYYVLALLALGRFAWRLDAGFWLAAASVVLAMKQQLAWEKYLFPTIAVMWTLVSLGKLSGYRDDARTAADENGLVTHALPSAGLST